MTMDTFDRIMEIVLRAEPLGSRTLPNGVRLIGNVPHIAPEAYLHVSYPPLDEAQIVSVEDAIDRQLPDALRTFYRCSNGIQLFAYALSIDGLRHNYNRTGDEAWQPYSIITPNVTERPPDADDSFVFFGGYEWDGSLLGMSPDTPVVYRCAAGSARPLNKWPTFDEMLLSEVNRLSSLFDDKGHKLVEDEATIPST